MSIFKCPNCHDAGLPAAEVPCWKCGSRTVAPDRPLARDCAHEEFAATVAVGRILDVGKFVADIRISCAHCGEPFRFVGVPAGLRFDGPAVSIDGLELHAPIEPELERRLMDRASFQVPTIPTRQ